MIDKPSGFKEKKSEFEGLDKWFGKSMNQQSNGADPADGNETPV
jgi:site-specific recombinase, phage integrase family